jgi:hypothetical protein
MLVQWNAIDRRSSPFQIQRFFLFLEIFEFNVLKKQLLFSFPLPLDTGTLLRKHYFQNGLRNYLRFIFKDHWKPCIIRIDASCIPIQAYRCLPITVLIPTSPIQRLFLHLVSIVIISIIIFFYRSTITI